MTFLLYFHRLIWPIFSFTLPAMWFFSIYYLLFCCLSFSSIDFSCLHFLFFLHSTHFLYFFFKIFFLIHSLPVFSYHLQFYFLLPLSYLTLFSSYFFLFWKHLKIQWIYELLISLQEKLSHHPAKKIKRNY